MGTSVATNPVFTVVIFPSQADGGGQINVSEHVISLAYEDHEAQLDKLTLDVDNFDLTNFDAPVWKAGNKLEVSWGYDGNMSPPRTLRIQKVTGSTQLKVEALDEGCLMNRNHVVKTWERLTRSDVAKAIAEANGYTGERVFIDDTVELQQQVTQARMTDAQLLRDMAKREGFEFYIDFDGFHFHKRKLGQKPLRTFTYYTDPGLGDVLSFNVENDLFTRKAGAMTAKGIDPKTGKPIVVTADNVSAAAAGQTALAPTKKIIAGLAVNDGHPTGDFEKDTGSTTTNRTTEKTADSATRKVLGEFGKNQLCAAILTLEVRGDPSMIAKIVITVNGIGKTLSGNYYVTNVNHKVGAGFLQTIKCRRDGVSAPNNAAAYGEAAGKGAGAGAGGGVPAKGPHNGAPADDASDPLGLVHGKGPLTVLTNRDGSLSYADTRGRTQQGAPSAPADPLGLVHSEDTQPDGKR